MARYRAMESHWLRVGPPAYVTSAAAVGWKPPTPRDDDFLDDPDDLAAALNAFPGGHIG